MKIIKQELQFEESLKQRLEFIEPHRVIIKNITFLVFNYSNDVYISNLTKKIKLSELEEYIKNIYKGDFVHGKRTKHPTYYKDVVEPIVSKEMWEDCQVQKKKNSRSYQRTLTYLYLQKLKCPKCNRILGGKATTKKNGNTYFYYYCNDCKIQFKEKVINDYFSQFINELKKYSFILL